MNPSLRTRLLLLVLLGVVLPLGLLGIVVNFSARRTGVELVHGRLREALGETVAGFGAQWTQQRSLILDLAEAGAVVEALRAGRPWQDSIPGAAGQEMARLWSTVAPFLISAEILDLEGRVLGVLPRDLVTRGPSAGSPAPALDYTFDIRERFSGETLGSLRIRFRVDQLLPPGFTSMGVAGSIPGIFDGRSGSALIPLALEPSLFSRSEFRWQGEPWVAESLELEDPSLRFALAAPIEPVVAPFQEAARIGFWAILLTALLSIYLVSVFSRRLTRPLDDLAKAAREVAGGNLRAKARESGPPGVRDTARAFNAMSEALSRTLKELSDKESAAAVGAFASDLAHEVRNPLTAIRTDLQRAQKKLESDPATAAGLVDRAVASVDRLNTTVGNFLRVARSGNVTLVSCDLRESLQAAIRSSEPQRQGKECVMEADLGNRPCLVWGDPEALERLALNLLLNAVEAVPRQGRLGIRIQEEPDGNEVRVEVWDQGPGIAPDIRETLFDPFVSTRTSGTGLGLAIARRIARGHGSDLEVHRRAEETVFGFALKRAPG